MNLNPTTLTGIVLSTGGSVVCALLARRHSRLGNDFLCTNFTIPAVLLAGVSTIMLIGSM